jgi:hypothetical protein
MLEQPHILSYQNKFAFVLNWKYTNDLHGKNGAKDCKLTVMMLTTTKTACLYFDEDWDRQKEHIRHLRMRHA